MRRSDLALAAQLAASALALLTLLAAPALFAYAFANRLAAAVSAATAVAAALSLTAGWGWRRLACALPLSLPASLAAALVYDAALREGLPPWLAFALASAVAYLVLWAQLALALEASEAAKRLGLAEGGAVEEGGRR